MDFNLFFPTGTRVLALPSWQRPRLYLPAQRFVERWEGSSFYPASRFRAQLYRLWLRTKAAAGLAGVRAAGSDQWLLGEFVQDVLPQATTAAVLVGTAGPAQKVTVQLRDEEGRVLGYLKYGEKEAARRRLHQEHRMLSTITKGLGPEALKHGSLGEGKALLTTPVPGRRLPATLPPAQGVADCLAAFVLSPPAPVEEHPWVRSVREQGSKRAELEACFEALSARNWPIVAQHGDFAPWNLLRMPGGSIGAFDWEYGTLKGFPYLDIAHYSLQTAALVYRWAPAKAARFTLGYLAGDPRLSLSSMHARALTRLAAYDAWQKALEDGHAPNAGLQPWRRAIWEGQACSV